MSVFTCNLDISIYIKKTLIPLMFFSTSLAGQPYHLSGGYGTQTKGGLAGRIIKVTHLRSDGPGSLRAACEAEGERLVIFEVGGVIDLGKRPIKIKNPQLTIAGQTAPHPGITLIRGGINITTHDVVIQHIAVRPGEAGEAKGSGWEVDGMATWGTDAYNIVFDHCSVTWATDENFSVSGPPDSAPGESSHDVTLYGCIIAESLSHSTHSEGEHGKGTLLMDGVSNVSIIRCLYAHNHRRNPFLKGNTRAVIVNNLIYNSGSQCIGMTDRGKSPYIGKSSAVIVGNTWMTGPNSTRKTFVSSGQNRICGNVYFDDNILEDRSGTSMNLSLADIFIKQLNKTPFWPEGLKANPASESIPHVLRTAGARAKERDPIDRRIVQTVIDANGEIIDSEQDVGGYPAYDTVYQTIQVPLTVSERMDWLDSLALNLETDSTLNVTPGSSRVNAPNDNRADIPPDEYQLCNYPNPFNPSTTIRFELDHSQHIDLRVNYIDGRLAEQLYQGNMNAGMHTIIWDAHAHATGVYLFVLTGENGSRQVCKMLLIK